MKLWILSHFYFPKYTDLRSVDLAMCGETCAASYIRPRVIRGTAGVTTSPNLFCPVLVWNQDNFLRLLLTVKYFDSPRAALRATFLRRKAGTKMNGWNVKPLLLYLKKTYCISYYCNNCLVECRLKQQNIFRIALWQYVASIKFGNWKILFVSFKSCQICNVRFPICIYIKFQLCKCLPWTPREIFPCCWTISVRSSDIVRAFE